MCFMYYQCVLSMFNVHTLGMKWVKLKLELKQNQNHNALGSGLRDQSVASASGGQCQKKYEHMLVVTSKYFSFYF